MLGLFLNGLKWTLTAKPREFDGSASSTNYQQWVDEYYSRAHPWLTPTQWDDMLDQYGKTCTNMQRRANNRFDFVKAAEKGELQDTNVCYDLVVAFHELYYEGGDRYRLPWGIGMVYTSILGGWFVVYFMRARAIVEGFGEDKKSEAKEKFQSMYMLQVVLVISTVLAYFGSLFPIQWIIMEIIGSLIVLMWEKRALDAIKEW